MNITRPLSTLTLAVAAALPFGLALTLTALPGAAQAQIYESASATTISAFTVEQAPRLWPGSVLFFRLEGTPGAFVTLQIADASASVAMSEVRSGTYEGRYTLRQQDRLTEASRVSARLVKNGVVSTALLSRSLEVGGRDPAGLATPQITGYKLSAPERVRPGDELRFWMTGTPGATARVALQDVNSRIPLKETSQGVYEGSYVIRRSDKTPAPLVAAGYLVSEGREARQRFEHQTVAGGQQIGGPKAPACANCGAVQSVNVVEVDGESKNVIGTIAGGVLGGVLGNQVGGGRGKDLATVIGAVGGAYAGNRVENRMDKNKIFRVTVRLDGGKTQNFDYPDDPAVQVGTRVKVENGQLIRL